MKFGYRFHLLFVLSFFCFSCVKNNPQLVESDAKTCQANQVLNQYIVHWKNSKPTLNTILDTEKYLDANSQKIFFIEPNYRLTKQKMYIRNRYLTLEKNYFFRDLIHTDAAWKYGHYGQGIQVAIVDTGIDLTHPHLRSHLMINQQELNGLSQKDDDQNGFVDDIYGWNFISNLPNSEDEIGHGTAIAGLIVGDSDSPSLALAPKAKILAVDFMTATDATEFHAEQAISYALSRHVQIINNSWTIHCSLLLKDAFDRWSTENVIFVNASGNEPIDVVINQVTPTSFRTPNIINVGSSDMYGQRSTFSGYGNTVTLFAPGESLPIIYKNSGLDLNTSASGTSFSAAIVSGAAALVWSAFPKATAVEIIALLHEGAVTDVGTESNSIKILNIKKSISLGRRRFR